MSGGEIVIEGWERPADYAPLGAWILPGLVIISLVALIIAMICLAAREQKQQYAQMRQHIADMEKTNGNPGLAKTYPDLDNNGKH